MTLFLAVQVVNFVLIYYLFYVWSGRQSFETGHDLLPYAQSLQQKSVNILRFVSSCERANYEGNNCDQISFPPNQQHTMAALGNIVNITVLKCNCTQYIKKTLLLLLGSISFGTDNLSPLSGLGGEVVRATP